MAPYLGSSFLLPAPLILGRAGAMSLAIFSGYATGIALILFRLAQSERWRDAADIAQRDENAYPQSWLLRLLWMGAYSDDEFVRSLHVDRGRYSIRSWCDFGGSGETLYAIFAAVTVGIVWVHFAPLRLAPGHLWGAPSDELDSIRRAWRAELRGARVRWWRVWWAGAVVAFAIALLGESYVRVLGHLELERAWARGMPWTARGPKPMFAFLGGPDAALLAIKCLALAPVTVIVAAGRGMRAKPEVIGRWCLSCGFPRPTHPIPPPGALGPCTECGLVPEIEPGAQTLTRWTRWRVRLVLAGIVCFALAGFFAVPRLLSEP
jgi:hypothetical protein